MRKSKGMVLVFSAFMAAVILGSCGVPKRQETEESGKTQNKKIRFYGRVLEYTSSERMMDKLQEKFRNKYTIESLPVEWQNQEKIVRREIISGNPCDIYNFEMNRIVLLEDMAVDLKPYLDADPDWRAQFRPSALEEACVNGRILAVPWESNFPVILANKELLNRAEVSIPDSWNYEEFESACEKIKRLGVYPFSNAGDMGHGGWLYRNGMLSASLSNGTYERYTKGSLPLDGKESRETLQAIQSLYDKGYMYPGEQAVTARVDEIKAGFMKGETAMITEIGTGAQATAREAKKRGIETVVVPWPRIGDTDANHSGDNALFIPKNSKNVEAAIEIIKEYTSVEIQSIHLEDGYIPANRNVEVTDPFVKSVIAQTAHLYAEDPPSVDMTEYRGYHLIPDLILGQGAEEVMEKLEQYRISSQQGEQTGQ